MKTSIVIVSYNSEKTIKICLESIKNSNEEIIVVDNNSTDKTCRIVETYNQVKLIRQDENFGFGKANDLGVKNSVGDYLFFLNPDTKVSTSSVNKLAHYLNKNKDIAVVGPKLLNTDGLIQKEMAKFPTLLSQVLILLRLHRFPVFSSLVYPNYNYDETQEAEHLMGSALLIRRKNFEEVGGFDENFFLWFEETDLLKRIKDFGNKIVYYPEASITHLVGQSTKQLNFWNKQTIWNKSLLYYFRKHKTWLHILVLLPFMLLSYPAAFLVSLVKKYSAN